MKTHIVTSSMLLGAASMMPSQEPVPKLSAWQFIDPLTRYDAAALDKLVGRKSNEGRREEPVHFGTMINAFPFKAIDVNFEGNTTFRCYAADEQPLFPFCHCQAPDFIQLTYARTASDLLDLFVPKTAPDVERQREHFKNINNWAGIEVKLDSEEPFNCSSTAIYVRNGRFIAITCTMFFHGNPEGRKRTIDEPFRELSINCWISPVYVRPPE